MARSSVPCSLHPSYPKERASVALSSAFRPGAARARASGAGQDGVAGARSAHRAGVTAVSLGFFLVPAARRVLPWHSSGPGRPAARGGKWMAETPFAELMTQVRSGDAEAAA